MRLNVTDLVGHPGETRAVRRAVPLDAFGTDPWGRAEGAIQDSVELDLHLDAVVEGILVRGRIGYTLDLACGRCLAIERREVEVEVAELFIDPARRDEDDEDEPGYELLDDLTAIDLSTMARDALLIDLPVRVLCRTDCQGLCVVCGTDLNEADCGHRPGAAPDPRWAKLAELDLPEG